MSKKVKAITPAQCRAARGLLYWSQGDLAEHASVGQSTVADFERGARKPIRNNLSALIKAFEVAGVRFIPGGVTENRGAEHE